MHSEVVAARLKDTDDDVCYEAVRRTWLSVVIRTLPFGKHGVLENGPLK